MPPLPHRQTRGKAQDAPRKAWDASKDTKTARKATKPGSDRGTPLPGGPRGGLRRGQDGGAKMAGQDGGAKMAAWARGVRGLLLDISGVLYDSGGGGGGAPIAGSAEAVRK